MHLFGDGTRRALALVLVTAGGGVAFAQEAPADAAEPAASEAAPRPQPGDADFYGALLGDQFAGPIEGDERVVYAVGGVSQPVWIRQPGFELRCDAVVLWGDKDKLLAAVGRREVDDAQTAEDILGPVIHAIYAEGDVWMKRDRQLMRGERVFLDFQKGEAYLVNARMQGVADSKDGRAIPLAVRADVIRGVARDRYRAENASFTTCAYEDPHYHFDTGVLELDFTDEYVGFETGWWPSLRVDTAIDDDTPVLVLPKLGGRTFETRPLQNVGVGTSDRFGTTVEVTWGGSLKDEEGTKWGDWRVHTDYRSSRGPGVGVDLDIEGEGEPGTRDEASIRSYYQRDTAREDDFSERPFDGEPGGQTPADRGRLRAWFREHGGPSSLLPEGWRADGELALWSDRGFLPEYDRTEATTAKQQETFVSLRRLWGNQGVSLLASTRAQDEAVSLIRRPSDLFLTDYATQTEYLPSATYHLVNGTLLSRETTGFAPLGLSVQASVANVKRIWDETTEDSLADTLDWHATHVTRGDVETRLNMPFSVGPVHFSPAVGGSYMGVDEENGYVPQRPEDDRDDFSSRHSGFWSLRAGTEAHRSYDVDSDTFALHGLRHVASVDVQYLDRFEVSEDPLTYQTNDLIDELDEVRMGSVRLRNRLQTKRRGEVIDWIDYEIRFLQLFDDFDGQRSLLGYREDLTQPLQRLDFPGQDKYIGRESGSTYHQHRARMQVLPDVWLAGEGDYDMEDDRWETTFGGVRWDVDDQLSLYAGRRAIRDDSRVWTLRADYRLTNKWIVSFQQQENTRNNARFDTRITLYRRAHDMTFALEFESDNQLDETSISVAVYPNDWLGDSGDPLANRRDLDYEAMRWYR